MNDNSPFIPRRQAIATGGALLAGSILLPHRSWAQSPNRKDLVMRTQSPRNGEPELGKLVGNWLTPTESFYVRSHAPNPRIAADQFRLKVDGLVAKPMTLSLGDLAKYTKRKTIATLTCAGNRRAEYNEEGKVGGVQWGAGAIGNAEWAGYLLADLLKHVEVQENAKHVWFEGLDEIPKNGRVIPFGGSIPIEKAMIGEGNGAPLLVDTMNGEPLSADHGYPLRTVVPGYIGARSVKWLGKVVVSDKPSPNHYVANAYKIVKNTDPIDWSEAGPIYRYPINAVICNPTANGKFKSGMVSLAGYALPSGRPGSTINRVFVSTDPKKGWKRAQLIGDSREFCWQLWKATVRVTPETKQLFVRANDTAGQFMPYRVPWNAKGYLQNSWFTLPIEVNA